MLSRSFSLAATALWLSSSSPVSVTSFVVPGAVLTTRHGAAASRGTTPRQPLFGYLDELSKPSQAPADATSSSSREEVDADSTNSEKEQVDRYGVGSWEGFVDFEEFDGGDGQMGVAGECVPVV